MQSRVTVRTRQSSGASLACIFLLVFTAIMLTACTGQSGGNVQTVPTVPGSATPTEEVWTPPPTHPMMDKVWQPPEPKKRVEIARPTEVVDSPDAMLTYETANVGMSSSLKVTQDGTAVLGGYQGSYTTYKLSTQQFEDLKKKVADTDFFNLQERYWQEDPPGVIAEITIVTITYKEGGRSKSVALRGSANTPPALLTLETALAKLDEMARDQGTPASKPGLLVGYYLQGTGYTWWLDVDVEGGLYFGSGPADTHMSQEDLKALKDTLKKISSLGSDEWFTAPEDVRDTIFMDEHRAIITTYSNGSQSQWINALSGATVPPGLQAVLDKLAEIYDKYAPVQ